MKLGTRPATAEDDAAPRSSRWGLSIDAVWAALPILLPAFIVLAGTMDTIDLAYHLRAGDLILRTGSLPRFDTYTFSAAGTAWLDQQWGAQVLLAAADRVGGFATLSVLRALLVSLTLGLTYRACRVKGASPAAGSALCLAAMVVIVQSVAMRPQLFALPLFAGTMLILADRRDRPGWLWAIPAIAAAWANLHGSFVLAPVLVGLAFLEDVMRREARDARRLAAVGVVSMLATFLTPFGPSVWGYAASLSTNPEIRGKVAEWHPLALGSYAGGVFFLSSAVLAGWLARRGKTTAWSDLMWLGTFFVFALPAERGILWWGLGAPVIVAGLLSPRAASRSHPASDARPHGSLLHLAVVVVLVALCAIELPYRRPGGPASLLRGDPEGLVAAAASHVPPAARLFVPQAGASWFEYALPQDTVFVDSRIEVFPTSVWSEYEAVRDARPGWQQTLDRYGVDAVAVDVDRWPLASVIAHDPGWREVYRGIDGVLYVRAN